MRQGWLPGRIRRFTEKTAAPATSDDVNKGYEVSDQWFDETNDKAYVCLDVSVGAAVWEQFSATGASVTAHAASHVDGTDDIQDATSAQKGLATATQITKLDGIETSADVTDAVNIASSIVGVVDKATPVNADSIGLIDSESSNVLKELTWTNIKAFLKTYFDTLYNKYVHPNHSGEVTSVADGTQTIVADAVTYAKMQNVSATDKVLGRSSAGAGDVEEIVCTAFARSILDDANEAAFKATVTLEIGIDVQAYDADIALFRRHTLESGDDLMVGEDEQKMVHENFIINGTGSITINGSGQLSVIGV